MALTRQVTRKLIGVILIACVVVIWVGSSELIQLIFKAQSFNKPMFLTYYNTGLFSWYLLGFLIVPSWTQSLISLIRNKLGSSRNRKYIRQVTQQLDSEEVAALPVRFNITQTMLTSLMLCPLWFLANITFNYSLSKTSVTSNTIISNTSSLFTFILSLVIGIDAFSFMRLAAIGLSIGGVALVTVFDTSDRSGATRTGNLLTLFSAFMYGTYTTFLKKRIPDESGDPLVYEEVDAVNEIDSTGSITDDEHEHLPIVRSRFVVRTSMPMVFGFVGLFNLLMLWPLFFVLHGLGVESFALPTWKVFLSLTVNGLIGTMLSDLLWALSVVLTSAVVATIGLTLTIPLSFAADLVIHNKNKFSVAYIIGSLLVVCSFVIANISYYLPENIRMFDSPNFRKIVSEKVLRRRSQERAADEDYSVRETNEEDES